MSIYYSVQLDLKTNDCPRSPLETRKSTPNYSKRIKRCSCRIMMLSTVLLSPWKTVVSTVENQPAEEPPTLKFTWTIPNFSRQNTRKLYSDVSVVGGYKWRILIFPKVMLIHTVDEIVSLYEDLTARNLADDQENTVDEIVSLTSLLKSFTH
ncbi:hypothetical protein Bca4012_012407 [Brassica carinata]